MFPFARKDYFPSNLAENLPLSTPIDTLQFTVFDTETTGFNLAKEDRIIELGAVTIKGMEVIEHSAFQTYVNPNRQIPREITELTGIANEQVAIAPDAMQAIRRLTSLADKKSACYVGHYIAFDMHAIKYELKRRNLHWKAPKAIDTLNLIGYIAPSYDMRDLEKYARDFGTRIYQRHSAIGDAMTTAFLFVELLHICHDRGIRTWGDLLRIGEGA
ncbi:DNA polymerase-3 subunit epsilon [Bacillus tianshenii]|uniref:DNA polymerase-3 subunit epsilon n=1 Tax=Sutcliffiella tianshenii TaxID=1463404 RepID=A0ABS2NVA9_9BACI|nr:3'-5' exonuclease [Bacillus tianshenii]MBM7618599.1 DNA polymerase-3 subunit epsilon [Bacillus tianshenii]